MARGGCRGPGGVTLKSARGARQPRCAQRAKSGKIRRELASSIGEMGSTGLALTGRKDVRWPGGLTPASFILPVLVRTPEITWILQDPERLHCLTDQPTR